ncbi:MAG: hypothetical protein AABW50_01270 [Nanoarchaeota archaeon]
MSFNAGRPEDNLTMIKKFFKELPKLPLSAFIFYLIVMVLRVLDVIPPPSEIIAALENLLDLYGVIVIFISVLLEGIVYFGFYFPGTTIVTISILLSNGEFSSFLSIALASAFALTITSIFNYILGRRLPTKFDPSSSRIKKALSKGLILSIIHPNTLSFYFFDSGIKRQSPWKIAFVPFLIAVYGIVLSIIIYSFKSPFKSAVEMPYILLCLIFVWLVVSYFYEKRKKKHLMNVP